MNQQVSHVAKTTHGKWLVLLGALVLIGIVMYQTSGDMLQQNGLKVALRRGAARPCALAVLTVRPRLPRRKNVYFRFGKIPKPLILAKKLIRQARNGNFKKLRQNPRYKGPNIFVPVSRVLNKRKGPLTFNSLISYTQKSKIWMSKLEVKIGASSGTKICRFVSNGQATFQMNVQLPVKSIRGARQQKVMKFDVTYTSGCQYTRRGRTTNVVIGMKTSSGKNYKMVVCDARSCRVYAIVSTYRLVRDVQKQKIRKGNGIVAKKPNVMITDDREDLGFLEKDYLDVLQEQTEDEAGGDDDEY